MLLAATGARLLLRGVVAGQLPARRSDPPAAVARRPRRRRARGHGAGRRAVHDLVRPAARRRDRPQRRPAQHPAGHRDAHVSARAARSSRRSTSAGPGSTATSSTSARSGSARRPASVPGRCCSRARTSEPAPRSLQARRSSGASRTASSGPGSPAARVATDARGPWSTRPDVRRSWVLAYAAAAAGLSLLPVLAIVAGALPPLLADAPDGYADAAAPAGLGAAVDRPRAGCAHRVRLGRGAGGRARDPPGGAPRPEWPGTGRVGDHARARRGPDLALPALLLPADGAVAALAGGADRAATSRRRPC